MYRHTLEVKSLREETLLSSNLCTLILNYMYDERGDASGPSMSFGHTRQAAVKRFSGEN